MIRPTISCLLLQALLWSVPAAAQNAWPARIDDTGLTTCYSGDAAGGASPASCANAQWPGQDAASGRDAVGAGLPKIGAGDAGFDFTKISNAGNELPPSAVPGNALNAWGCTRDNVTGLVWRVRVTGDASWNGARAAALAANAGAGVCGFRDWRLPTVAELGGIVHFGRSSPAVDADYFPDTPSAFHWTSEAASGAPAGRARIVNFNGGFVHAIAASSAANVRLVRGGDVFDAPVDNGDGTVTDPRTGLMWDRCSLGQDAAGGCSGSADFGNWHDALAAVQARNAQNWRGHSDWRLPNVKELLALVDPARGRPTIDGGIFPGTQASAYWSSSTNVHVTHTAWAVFFGEGEVFSKGKATRAAMRLVRQATPASSGLGAPDGLFADGFDAADAPPVSPEDRLPTITLDTSGAPIDHDNYVNAFMTITATDEAPAYSGTLKIKGRGNSTWSMPKKPYRLKLDVKSGLLGMHSDKNWALLANFADKTLLRNAVAQSTGMRLGMAWSPDSRYAKVVLNGSYVGVYQLIETIRVDHNRIDIAEIEPGDVAPPEVTGGYVFEIDSRLGCDVSLQFVTVRGVPICIDTPDEDAIVTPQYDYLTGYIQATEDAINAADFADPAHGYRAWLDPASFIDWFLVNELTANVDAAGFSSIWNYKDRNGLLQRGPLWDFDLGNGNADYCHCADPQGFWVRDGTWYNRLFTDPAFAAQVRARWDAVKADAFDTLPALIDAQAATLRGAVDANFVRWPILDTYTWPNVVITGSWEGELDYSKDWFRQRVDWLDANL